MELWRRGNLTNGHANKVRKKRNQENTYKNLHIMDSSSDEVPVLTMVNVTYVLDGFKKPKKFV
jgi:hypothetical protein